MLFEHDDLLKLGLAVVAGGLIGFEREFRDKPAGLRTLIFICVGSAAFTMLSIQLADAANATRIAANVVSGIGFLGAGVILRDKGRVVGITTAATIWLTAALGMAIGGGQYGLALKLLAFTLMVLWFFPLIEEVITRRWQERDYEIAFQQTDDGEQQLTDAFKRHGLGVQMSQQKKTGDTLHFIWRAGGPKKSHERLIKHLIGNPAVKEFHV